EEGGSPFELILISHSSLGSEGRELEDAAREIPAISDTPIIVIAAMGQRSDLGLSTSLRISGILHQPLRESRLRQSIEAIVLRGGRAIGELIGDSPLETPPEPRRSRARILLAEDNATNQFVALKILEKIGYKADAVADGSEVLAALALIPYDLILMDCQMPGMDGFESTRQIRTLPAPAGTIPIIAMTANAMRGDRERCIEAGMDDYLSKPVEPGKLAALLGKWLPAVEAEPVELEPLDDAAVPRADAAPSPEAETGSRLAFDRPAFLGRVMDDEGLARELIGIFLKDMPQQLDELATSIAEGDGERGRRIAHRIKGAAANMSADALSHVAGLMEAMGRVGDIPGLTRLLPELRRAFAAAKLGMESLGEDAGSRG
ncbi:MAG: response regulator, partial [Spirochaetota bacterium]